MFPLLPTWRVSCAPAVFCIWWLYFAPTYEWVMTIKVLEGQIWLMKGKCLSNIQASAGPSSWKHTHFSHLLSTVLFFTAEIPTVLRLWPRLYETQCCFAILPLPLPLSLCRCCCPESFLLIIWYHRPPACCHYSFTPKWLYRGGTSLELVDWAQGRKKKKALTYDSMITSERVSRVELGSFDIVKLICDGIVVSRSQVRSSKYIVRWWHSKANQVRGLVQLCLIQWRPHVYWFLWKSTGVLVSLACPSIQRKQDTLLEEAGLIHLSHPSTRGHLWCVA